MELEIQTYVEKLAGRAKDTCPVLASLSSTQKNLLLAKMASLLEAGTKKILDANAIDIENAVKKGLTKTLIDRLTLNEKRINGMADGLRTLLALEDPVGKTLSMWRRPNGLEIGQQRVPLGVVGIIYEARPNVTVDAAGLCLKAGNAVILKGGSEALDSNRILVQILQQALVECNLPPDAVQLIDSTEREATQVLMHQNRYIDVLIPRGGAGLIKAVVENSTIPVIETGIGNCHTYIDNDADLAMARNIAYNAKVQRPGVCNAMETLLVHEQVAEDVLPQLAADYRGAGVELRGCPATCKIINAKPASEEDWATEFLDLILAIKIVKDVDEAIAHINRYGTRHSEAIVTNNYQKARHFLASVDAAAVYVNASTRFTDGYEFGFGAEIGISTQKLHARGPMGLESLTTIKYIIYGEGQIRE
ncbi:MAG TPA: glutamate-5-semialdehyde dehydrogenase [Firmicutes bacterium]|jgi:glutamate-5-semialdehyde dehydrogenase|nr:glutamate-5-semialdehyde dehydrogenase [Bacillota bacterium]